MITFTINRLWYSIEILSPLSQMNEKSKIFHSVWFCAYQRRHMYRGTPREQREHDTILMCLNMKDVKFYQFDTEKPRYLK